MSNGRFDAIFIDFYGTISAGDREAVEGACEQIVKTLEIPMPAHAFAVEWGKVFFQTAEESNHKSFRNLHQCELISLKRTLLAHGRDVDPAPFVQILEDYWADPPVYEDAMEFLRSVNLPICCVSNADDSHIRMAVEKHQLRFDAVVTSESVRCYKPDRVIFEHAIRKMNVDPRRSLHVGDSLHSDVGGAAKLGITTVWLQRESRVLDIGKGNADHSISRLTELTQLLA